MKIIKMKQVCLMFLILLNFFPCAAMEDGHYPWVKNDSIIKLEATDFGNLRLHIQNNNLEAFKNIITLKTGTSRNTIDFLCTQNKNIAIARNEIVPEQREQIKTFLETFESKESYNEFVADELNKTKKDLFYVRTIGLAKIFSGLGISIGSTYLCSKAHSYFDSPLINFGTLIAGIVAFGSIGKALSDLPHDIAVFNVRKKNYDQKYTNAQGIMNFFENVKKLSEQNKQAADNKGAGQ